MGDLSQIINTVFIDSTEVTFSSEIPRRSANRLAELTWTAQPQRRHPHNARGNIRGKTCIGIILRARKQLFEKEIELGACQKLTWKNLLENKV